MLILGMRIGEIIIIGEEVKVILLEVDGKQVKVGIDAPPKVVVDREKVAEKKNMCENFDKVYTKIEEQNKRMEKEI